MYEAAFETCDKERGARVKEKEARYHFALYKAFCTLNKERAMLHLQRARAACIYALEHRVVYEDNNHLSQELYFLFTLNNVEREKEFRTKRIYKKYTLEGVLKYAVELSYEDLNAVVDLLEYLLEHYGVASSPKKKHTLLEEILSTLRIINRCLRIIDEYEIINLKHSLKRLKKILSSISVDVRGKDSRDIKKKLYEIQKKYFSKNAT